MIIHLPDTDGKDRIINASMLVAVADAQRDIGKAGSVVLFVTIDGQREHFYTNLSVEDITPLFAGLPGQQEQKPDEPAHEPDKPQQRYDYPGASIGLDPSMRWRLTSAHFDVNGKFGGPLAMMAHMEAENGASVILIYHLRACYGDAVPKPKTPKELVLRYVPGRSYRQPYPAGQARLDYCEAECFARPDNTIGLDSHLLDDID